VTNNSKTSSSAQSAEQRLIDLQLRQTFHIPSDFDNTDFLIKKSGFYDEYIMPELLSRKEQDIGG
jgi:hypothetical protein